MSLRGITRVLYYGLNLRFCKRVLLLVFEYVNIEINYEILIFSTFNNVIFSTLWERVLIINEVVDYATSMGSAHVIPLCVNILFFLSR